MIKTQNKDADFVTRTGRRGVTLPEITVVVAIVALLVGLTIPAANMLLNSFESESGAKSTINAAMASARAIAAKQQRYAGIRFQKRYDPANPDPVNESQYIIFIIQDPAIMAFGFKAVEGIQPIKLPDSVGVMDLLYDPNDLSPAGDPQVSSNSEAANPVVLSDTTTFSIIFSPSGKLVIHDVRTRNRDGYTATAGQLSNDDVFNRISQVEAGFGMFLQDDYYKNYGGGPVPNHGLGPESSRNSFFIYETKQFKHAYNAGSAWDDYLSRLKAVYINPYTGTIVNDK